MQRDIHQKGEEEGPKMETGKSQRWEGERTSKITRLGLRPFTCPKASQRACKHPSSMNLKAIHHFLYGNSSLLKYRRIVQAIRVQVLNMQQYSLQARRHPGFYIIAPMEFLHYGDRRKKFPNKYILDRR